MKAILFSLLCLFSTSLFAQTEVADQNPNFRISRSKYMAASDSMLRSQSTTIQDTYKAYDWMQQRQDRKDIRFQNRQQRRLNRSIYGNNYYYGGLQYGYYGNGYNNGFYGNNGYYNNNFYRNRYYNYRSPRFSDYMLWFLF